MLLKLLVLILKYLLFSQKGLKLTIVLCHYLFIYLLFAASHPQQINCLIVALPVAYSCLSVKRFCFWFYVDQVTEPSMPHRLLSNLLLLAVTPRQLPIYSLKTHFGLPKSAHQVFVCLGPGPEPFHLKNKILLCELWHLAQLIKH